MVMSGATSLYACLWCLVHRDNRWKVGTDSAPWTLQQLFECFSSKYNCSCLHAPLLGIPIDHIRIDELHLLLRVTDILHDNLRIYVIDVDNKVNFKSKGEEKSTFLDVLISCVPNCEVTYDVWLQKDADGSNSSMYTHTALKGDDKKRLLHHLPDIMHLFVEPELLDPVKIL